MIKVLKVLLLFMYMYCILYINKHIKVIYVEIKDK